jgi:hypothetical protein
MKKLLVFLFLITLSFNSYSKKTYHYFLKESYHSSRELFSVLGNQGLKSTNNLFKWCCDCISYYAKVTGYTYEEMNIILFVIGQPSLIIFFMILFFRERYKRKTTQLRYCQENP